MSNIFIRANWKNLVMLNYEVDAKILLPYLPPNTELDDYNEKHYISLIAFMFYDTRIYRMKVPFHISFEEVNLRFYAKYKDDEQEKHGVVFIREIVRLPALSFFANSLYKEKYITRPMSHFQKIGEDEIVTQYKWKHAGKWNFIEANTSKDSIPITEDSFEEFISQREWGFSKRNALSSYIYQVKHPIWNLMPMKNLKFECDFEGNYGKQFAFLQNQKPLSFMVDGSAVELFGKQVI